MKSGMNCIRDVERIFGIFIRRCIFGKMYRSGDRRPCVDFKVVDVNGKEGMFSDYVKSGKYNMLEVWACGHCRVVIPH